MQKFGYIFLEIKHYKFNKYYISYLLTTNMILVV